MMTVRLIAHTPEPEKVVAAAAKLCYSDSHIPDLLDGLDEARTARFLDMLSDLGHASPIEHASFTFGIEGVSRSLLAQITRHRIASFSVQSQRYVRLDDFRYVVPPAIEAVPEAKAAFLAAMEQDAASYLDLAHKLEEGHAARLMAEGMPEREARRKAEKLANEDARFALPNACETKMVVTMNARSLHNFFRLRCCERAQWERGAGKIPRPAPGGRSMSAGEKRGRLLVIEGLDGSGKATQAKLLAAALAADGLPVRQVSFPNYASESSALVRMYLAGQFGQKPDDVNAYAASSFFAVDRYASYKTDWGAFYRDGGVVLADRYTTSNGAHQCSKLPPEAWDGYLEWLFRFEYDLLGLPAPDAVIYLRVDPAVSQKLMTARYHGDESRKDIQERDLEYLARSRAAAEYCARKLGWQAVECARNGEMRPVEEIGREVLALARAALE